jgi:pyruvate formate lyase activating enzyme
MNRGMVLNIQKFSIHDGPGIRTLVFMKGCPLKCSWCSNPESQKRSVELRLIQSRCANCGKCIEACPNSAVKISKKGEVVTDRRICKRCGRCVEVCLYEARLIAGEYTTVEDLLKKVEEDRSFYENSGGGVTVGGGEPAYQHAFVRDFLKRCTERWLHTVIETCGYAPWKHLKEILEYVDFLIYDIKHIDPATHKRLTGVSNKLILENLSRITSSRVNLPIIIRVPIIPGLNDSEANVSATAQFVSQLGSVQGMELLPYHRLGMSKYEQFGMDYKLEKTSPPSDEHMKKLGEIIELFGLSIY